MTASNRSERIIELAKEVFDEDRLDQLSRVMGSTPASLDHLLERPSGLELRAVLLMRILREVKAAGLLDAVLHAVDQERVADEARLSLPVGSRHKERDAEICRLADEEKLSIREISRRRGLSTTRVAQIIAAASRAMRRETAKS